MFVAIPTAMPLDPFTSNCGIRRWQVQPVLSVNHQSLIENLPFLFRYPPALLSARRCKPGFGITHCCRRITIRASKISLSIDKRIIHAPFLPHSHQCIINGRVAMRMIFSQHLSYYTCTFFIGRLITQTEFIHCIQYPAVNRFKAIRTSGRARPTITDIE